MTGRWKPWKAEGRLSTRSHRPLEISQTREITTFPQLGQPTVERVENQKQVSHSYHARPANTTRVVSSRTKPEQEAQDPPQAAGPERRYSEDRRLSDGRKDTSGFRRFQDHYSIGKC